MTTDTTEMTIEQIHQLARACLIDNGCDHANAEAVATTVSHAERDGSVSHGLFRIPGYVAALQHGILLLAEAAAQSGVAVLALVRVHHFAALWHETEALAAHGLAALACTAYKPAVAPAGARSALFGTNPISFAWPRPDDTPVVYDMASASIAMGEVQIAARDGHEVPPGTGRKLGTNFFQCGFKSMRNSQMVDV